MKPFEIFLSEPHQSGDEQDYLQRALLANSITTGGEIVTQFEFELARFFNHEVRVNATNSGTSAIHLGLLLLGVQKGDEVLCQSFTFSASVNPVLYLGATPVFIGSESETWNMCPLALENAIQERMAKGKKPKAIIVVDLYGMPFQVDAISAVAIKYEIPILEDSAEALGSRYKGRLCGTLGSVGILSFNGNKIITTSSGGAVLVATEKQKNKVQFWASQSKDEAPHYQHSEVGYNYGMSTIAAAIGLAQLQLLDQRIEARRANHFFYAQLFETFQCIRIQTEPRDDFYSNFWLTTILIDSELSEGKTANDLRHFMQKQGIETRPLWKPMHLQPVFNGFAYFGNKFEEELFQKGLCLPSSSNMSHQQKSKIRNAIQEFFRV